MPNLSKAHRERLEAAKVRGLWYCTKCKEDLPEAEFYRRNTGRLSVQCKRCSDKQFMLRTYGLTFSEYEAMLIVQGGRCAICREPETLIRYGKVHRLAIDHDHTTGEIRGLLCAACNRMVGYGRDSSTILEAAASYLRSSEKVLA